MQRIAEDVKYAPGSPRQRKHIAARCLPLEIVAMELLSPSDPLGILKLLAHFGPPWPLLQKHSAWCETARDCMVLPGKDGELIALDMTGSMLMVVCEGM